MRVVLDANVIASGVCWDGEAYLCLVKLARRHALAFGTGGNPRGDEGGRRPAHSAETAQT